MALCLDLRMALHLVENLDWNLGLRKVSMMVLYLVVKMAESLDCG
jgi:hypothetical protein